MKPSTPPLPPRSTSSTHLKDIHTHAAIVRAFAGIVPIHLPQPAVVAHKGHKVIAVVPVRVPQHRLSRRDNRVVRALDHGRRLEQLRAFLGGSGFRQQSSTLG